MVGSGVPGQRHDTGESILLLHCMASRSNTRDDVAAAQDGVGRRGIAPDLRGHDRSSRGAGCLLDIFCTDVCGLLDHLRIVRAELVGHSLGTAGSSDHR